MLLKPEKEDILELHRVAQIRMIQLKKSILSIGIIAGSTLLLSGYSSSAHAGYYKHGHGYYGGKGYHYGHRRHRRGYHRRHRHSDRAAYLVGGLALGALISHAYHTPHRRHYRHSYRHSYPSDDDTYVVREVSRPTVVRKQGRVTRSLFRDRDGNCFERKQDGDQELLIELPDRECAW